MLEIIKSNPVDKSLLITEYEQKFNVSYEVALLAEYLEIDASEIDASDYLILSDEEADTKAHEAIVEIVWAFRPEFLAAHLKDGIDIDVIKAIQNNGKCEDNNKAILSLIDDVDHFVYDAISCDGRGHFLSSYDGEEIELHNDLYAYRIN